jgi:programmed cell death protein 5
MSGGLPEGFTSGEDKAAQMEEQIAMMMDSILLPEAKERLARVSLVRKEQAHAIKMKLIDMARSGQLREQVSEAKLVEMLEEGQASAAPKVSIQRRKYDLDDEEEDNDDDLM